MFSLDLLRPEPPGPIVFTGRLPEDETGFPAQRAYECSTDMFNAVECSRRAGKTRGAVRRHARVLATAPRGSWTHFGSLVRRNARKHFWKPLKDELDRLGWDYKANESDMILEVIETGNFCQAFGCDDERGTKAPQGDGSALFTIDEGHLFNDDVLTELIKVAEPMLSDRGGMLDVLGLPPRVKETYFAKAIDSGGYKVFGWHQFDHDYPRPREEKLATVKELCERNKQALEVIETVGPDGRPKYDCGPNTDPEVAWKYFGKRTEDMAALAYKYQRGVNDYDPVSVNFDKERFVTGWGIDLGFQDADAIVIASTTNADRDRKIFVRWQWSHNHLDVFVLADVVRAVREVLRPSYVTGDHGGHGATAILESLGTVLGLNIDRKPQDVMVSVGLVNDDYTGQRLFLPTQDVYTALIIAAARRIYVGEPQRLALVEAALTESKADLAAESGKVTRSVNPRTKKVEINKRGFHSDLTEALRMCHSGLVRAPARPVVVDTNRPSDPQLAAEYDRELNYRKERQEQRRKQARPF